MTGDTRSDTERDSAYDDEGATAATEETDAADDHTDQNGSDPGTTEPDQSTEPDTDSRDDVVDPIDEAVATASVAIGHTTLRVPEPASVTPSETEADPEPVAAVAPSASPPPPPTHVPGPEPTTGEDDGFGPDSWRARLHRARVPITLAVLLLFLAGAAWYGWQSLLGAETSTRDQPQCTTPTPGAKQTVSATDVGVSVYNAGNTAGLADKTAASLGARGFTIADVGNDPDEKSVTNVEIRGRAKDAPEVVLLAAQVKGATIVPDERTDSEVDLVIGDKFTSLRVKAPTSLEVATKTPMCQTPGPNGANPGS